MEISDSDNGNSGKQTAAVSLEISCEVAEQAEKFLSDFAEDAGLETALIVDRSGALVAGISSEEDVTVDVISDLVAGASGAMRALVDQLGETGEIESLHQGGDRLLYIREVVTRFILVGVSDSSYPPGIVREKAAQLQPELADLLRDIKPLDIPPPKTTEKPKSLRAVAAERAAARVKVELIQIEPVQPEEECVSEEIEDSEEVVEEVDGEEVVQESSEEEVTLEELDSEELPGKEPVEVLEPLDLGEPEIVIEGVSGEPVDAGESPFELEDDESVEDAEDEGEEIVVEPAESIFELEEEDSDSESEADEEEIVFEIDEEDDDEQSSFEPEVVPAASEPDEDAPETVFEFDEASDEESSDEESSGETVESSEDETEQSEEDESEAQSTGPLYF